MIEYEEWFLKEFVKILEIENSVQIPTNNKGKIRFMTQSFGPPKLQGAFMLEDALGLTMDLIYDVVVLENKLAIDWIEALIDATRQGKLISCAKKIEKIIPNEFFVISSLFWIIINDKSICPGTDAERAEFIYNEMHRMR